MDKLRACIVANYYASAGMTRLPEVNCHTYHNKSAASHFKAFTLYKYNSNHFLCVLACFQE